MASSSYYYNMYKQKKKEVEDYDDDLYELNKILSNLTDNLYDEIRAVNDELDDLVDDLNKGVRHNALFTSRANTLANEKEKAVGLDSYLSASKDSLEDEIASIKNLKSQAISDRDNYYSQYTAEKAEEKAALENKLNKLL